MYSSLLRLFCKTAECPSSEALLDYSRSLMPPMIPIFIKDHLASCDFCGAEVLLLARYRDEPEEHSFAEMPEHLRRLAEDILKGSSLPFLGETGTAESVRVSN
jgi:hypothetical protein